MLLLPGLPEEILLQIVNYLLPDDIDSFSESRKEFHAISTRILPKHEQLKYRYSEVYCGLFGHESHHPLFMLRDICRNPDIVWYVKRMHIRLCADEDIDGNDKNQKIWDEAQSIAVECRDGIIKMVKACPYLNAGEHEGWINATLSCRENTAVALLACMLPCLEGIRITNNYENTELHCLVAKIRQENNRSPGGSHALSKLKLIQEESCTPEVFVEMPSFQAFSGLPSMRRYVGQYLAQKHEWTPFCLKSTITSLEFNESMIHVGALRSVFSGIKNLRSFRYEYYWAQEGPDSESQWVDYERDWQPGQIILGLLQFAGHSLVELDLTRNGSREMKLEQEARRSKRLCLNEKHDGDDKNAANTLPGTVNLFMGSLRGFRVLKYIRVQNEAFVEEDPKGAAGGRQVHRLVDLLPASVVRIALAMPRLCHQESCRLIQGLSELKAERVPKLEEVIAESGNHTKMKTVHRTGGIQFIQ